MSDLDKLFNEALKKPNASAVTESGEVVQVGEEPKDEVTQVTAPAPEETPAPAHVGHPWEEGNERVLEFFQIRMPETLKMKIEWLANLERQRGDKRCSQHRVALTALEREIDRLIAKEMKGKTK